VKKILFTVMGVVLCLGLMGGAFAYFSDTEESTGNTFTAGTIDLELGSSAIVPMTFTNMEPGVVTSEYTWSAQNTGSLPGQLSWSFDSIIEADDDGAESALEGALQGEVSATAFADKLCVEYAEFDRNCDGSRDQDGANDVFDYTHTSTVCASPVTPTLWAGLTAAERKDVLALSTWGGSPGGVDDEWVLPDWARWGDKANGNNDGYLSISEIATITWTVDDTSGTAELDPNSSETYRHYLQFILDPSVGNPFMADGIAFTLTVNLNQK